MSKVERWSERLLGYHFNDPSFLQSALTHRSAGPCHNERLEFLGDSFLNYVIGAELFRRLPRASEGDLSRMRAKLVRGETLTEIASELGLGEHLNLGRGELKTGGFRRASILADAFEAVIGAVLLDGGHDACSDWLLSLYAERLGCLPSAASLKDAKTRLQEYLQARKLALPDYRLEAATGEAHKREFDISCHVPSLNLVSLGHGSSRRRAEQAAAKRMIEMLEAQA